MFPAPAPFQKTVHLYAGRGPDCNRLLHPFLPAAFKEQRNVKHHARIGCKSRDPPFRLPFNERMHNLLQPFSFVFLGKHDLRDGPLFRRPILCDDPFAPPFPQNRMDSRFRIPVQFRADRIRIHGFPAEVPEDL